MNFDNSNNILFGSHSSNKRLAEEPKTVEERLEELEKIQKENLEKEPKEEKGTKAPSRSSGVDSVNKMLLELAAKRGQLAQLTAADLQKRDVLISRLLTLTSEDNVIKIITKGLSEYSIPFEDFIDICNEGINASYKTGQSLNTVLDFALFHYKTIQNPQLTSRILEDAASLQSKFRAIPVFDILISAFMGNADEYMNNPLLFGKDMDAFNLMQDLIGLATLRKAEDYEVLRRKYQDDTNRKIRALEIADQQKAIADMLESNEFVNAEIAAIQEVAKIFGDSQTNPRLKMFGRLFRELKLGQEYKDQFLSGIQGDQTAIPTYDRRKNTPDVKKVTSSVKTAQGVTVRDLPKVNAPKTQGSPLQKPAAVQQTTAESESVFNKNKPNVQRTLTLLISDINKVLAVTSKNQNLAATTKTFSRTVSSLGSILKELPTMNSKQFELKFFPEISRTGSELQLQSMSSKKANANSNNKFIKVSQSLGAPNPTTDPFFDAALTVVGGLGVLNAFLSGDISGALGLAASGWLLFQQYAYATAPRVLGRNLPKNQLTPQQVQRSAKMFEALGATQTESKTLVTLEQYRQNVKQVISNFESALSARIEGEVSRGKDLSSIASAPPEEIKREYQEYYNLLLDATKIIQYENNLIDNLKQRAMEMYGKNKILSTSNLLDLKAEVSKDLREFFLAKLRKYKSFTLFADNYQKSQLVLRQLKSQIPDMQNLLGIGINVANMIMRPGGVLGALQNLIDLEKNNKEKIMSSILSKDPDAFKKFYNTQIAKSPVTAPQSQEPQPGVIPQNLVASNKDLQGFRFSNLITEAQSALPQPKLPNPLEALDIALGKKKVQQPRALSPQELANKANNKLANLLKEMGFEYDSIGAGVPYLHLNYSSEKLSFLKNQILSIPDVQLRDAVTAQLDKKLNEYQEEAAQAQTAEAQSIIEKIGLDKYFDDISKQPGIGAKIKPSPETQAQIDEYEMSSLQDALQTSQTNLSKLEGVYLELLTNPSSLGSLTSFASENNKFVKVAKEDPKDETFEYWDELLPGYGDIFENPEEHLDQTVQEVEEEEKKKNPKHNK